MPKCFMQECEVAATTTITYRSSHDTARTKDIHVIEVCDMHADAILGMHYENDPHKKLLIVTQEEEEDAQEKIRVGKEDDKD